MPSERHTFPNARGARLAALLELPFDRPPAAYAVFAHCFTCSKDLQAVGRISRVLAREGFAVLSFDFTGLGESEGDFSETTFSSGIDDVVAAARFLESRYEAPSLLVGHSLGGAAVLQAARRLEAVTAVATIAAPYDPRHVRHLFEHDVAEIERQGAAVVHIGQRPFRITAAFLQDLEEHRVRENLASLRRALLLLHAPADDVVGIENAALLFQAAKHPKSFVSLDDADHLLTDPSDAEYAGTVLAAWARRYAGGSWQVHPPAPDGSVTAHVGASGYATEVRAGGFTLRADEPVSLGGTGTGPTPYDYLAAALGSCTVMTLRMYADRKGWPLEGAGARLEHAKIHAADCAACETKEGKIDRIERELELEGPLSPEQRQRLLEIAERCPVHRTLEGEIRIETRLKQGAS
jgi:putative redox protein